MKNLIAFLSLVTFCACQSASAQQFISNAPDFNGEVTEILPINGDCVLVFGNFNHVVSAPSNAMKLSSNQNDNAYDGRITLMEYPIVQSAPGIYQFMAKRADVSNDWLLETSMYTYNAHNNSLSRLVLPGEGKIFQIDKAFVYPIPEDGYLQRISLTSLTIDSTWAGSSISNLAIIDMHVSDSIMVYTHVVQDSFYLAVRDNLNGSILHEYIIPEVKRSSDYPSSELFSIGDSLFVQTVTESSSESKVFVYDTFNTRFHLSIAGTITDAAIVNNEVVLAGDFIGYSDLVVVNPQSGVVSDLFIDVAGEISAIDSLGQGLRVAGIFDSINGVTAHNYAEIDFSGAITFSSEVVFSKVSQLYYRDLDGNDSIYLGINLKEKVSQINSPVIYDAAQNNLQPFSHAIDQDINPIAVNDGKLLYRFNGQGSDIAVLLNLSTGAADTILQTIGDYEISHVWNDKVYLFSSFRKGNDVISIDILSGDTLVIDHGGEQDIWDIQAVNDSLLILASSKTTKWATIADDWKLISADISTGAFLSILDSNHTTYSITSGIRQGMIRVYGDTISYFIQETGNQQHYLSRLFMRPAPLQPWSSVRFSSYYNDGELIMARDYNLSASGIMMLSLNEYNEEPHLNSAIWAMNDGTLPFGNSTNPSFSDSVGGLFSSVAATDNFMILGGLPNGRIGWQGYRSGGRAFAVFTNPVIQGPPLAIDENIQQTFEIENIVYPNPAGGLVKINPAFQNAQILVYSSSGQLVLEANSVIELNLIDCPKGLYLVKAILMNGKRSEQKLIIR